MTQHRYIWIKFTDIFRKTQSMSEIIKKGFKNGYHLHKPKRDRDWKLAIIILEHIFFDGLDFLRNGFFKSSNMWGLSGRFGF